MKNKILHNENVKYQIGAQRMFGPRKDVHL